MATSALWPRTLRRQVLPAFAFLFFCLVVGIGGAPPAGAAATAESVLRGLQDWLDGTESLEARFEQSLVSGALGSGAKESGRLFVRRPGRMRWEYSPPDAKVALLVGDRTELYLPQDRQLLRGTLSGADSPIPALLAGQGRLQALFSPHLLPPPAKGSTEDYRLRLVPKAKTDGFEEVTLTLRVFDHAVLFAEVVDGAGNRMAYRFRAIRRNHGVPESLFHFVPPKGTEIVDRS